MNMEWSLVIFTLGTVSAYCILKSKWILLRFYIRYPIDSVTHRHAINQTGAIEQYCFNKIGIK